MNKQKEMTACNTSVGADDRQSLHVTNYSINQSKRKYQCFSSERRWYEWLNLKSSVWMKLQSKKVNWLWYPYIPYGKITIIQGDPGEAKQLWL